ncbi:PREDICTED: 30S ribosomal protein S5, chloroplastic [Nicotiana attenuata]|uniref:Small ribosomal subunit protein uS5c n=1 Tax=Nicotiana attenuata TaxID=49451 RepID=A0A1J6LAE3_NICAT|nr:PREDICTED: 30S ribosomal protein S5, chloroplastic [Nicotiana attenuata]OIT28009.1 30s ribosomal protein s5, chloroplastic [Nicotiana attenuata]
MAAASASLSAFSSLSLHTTPSRFSPFQSQSFFLPKPIHLSKLKPITANSTTAETTFFDNTDPEEISTFDPPERPEDFIEPPSFDDGPLESEEDIAKAYEELYGPAYSGETFLGNDIYTMDSKVKKTTSFGKTKKEKAKDGFDERVVQVRRVTKVVKGGKQLHFRAIVVVGDKKGQVGVGVGKAKEVIAAVQKSAVNARRNIITVPMTKYLTFPHRSEGDFGAARVMLRPAAPGTGVIAGGAVRIVLEMAGVENALGKQLGSNNALNNARATVVAVQQMRQFSEVAQDRGIPMEELWK